MFIAVAIHCIENRSSSFYVILLTVA